ncbi:unnamed protein product [Caenorhabditis brenneri]
MESCQGQQFVNELKKKVEELVLENEAIEEHVEFFLEEDAKMTKEIDALNQRNHQLEKEKKMIEDELQVLRSNFLTVTAEKEMMRDAWEDAAMRIESVVQEMYISFHKTF